MLATKKVGVITHWTAMKERIWQRHDPFSELFLKKALGRVETLPYFLTDAKT